MPKFRADWQKQIIITGTVEVEAKDKDEVEQIVLDNIGDYEGKVQERDPSEDRVLRITLLD